MDTGKKILATGLRAEILAEAENIKELNSMPWNYRDNARLFNTALDSLIKDNCYVHSQNKGSAVIAFAEHLASEVQDEQLKDTSVKKKSPKKMKRLV